jgi:hypothetical protein
MSHRYSGPDLASRTVMNVHPSAVVNPPGSTTREPFTDDVVDAFLAALTNGKVTGDKVGPHIDLLAEFPY